MFIHDLACDWLSHPFFRTKRKITSEKVIEKIVSAGITEVFIDVSRGLDVAEPSSGMESAGGEPTGPEPGPAEPIRPEPCAVAAADRQEDRGYALALQEDGPGNDRQPGRRATVEPTFRMEAAEPPAESSPGREARTMGSSLTEEEPSITKSVSLKEEIHQAAEIKREVKQITQKLMQDVRLGKQIEEKKVRDVVDKIIDSTLRNQDALLNLGTIRKTDEHTYMHSLSVCTMMIVFCSSLYLKRNVVAQVGMGALLHDIGKSKLPPALINKTGALTEEEEEKMKEHVALGIEVFSETPGITPISMSVAAEHHEHYDGTGYPKGLKEEEISMYGQIAAIVNMYDNITSDRGFRKGMSPTVALSRLLELSNQHFNEELVQRFIRRIGIYPVGTLVKLDNGFLGVVLEQGSRNLLNPVVRLVYDTKKGWFIKPRDLNLSNQEGEEEEIKIVSPESPEKWRINPKTYLCQFVETSLLSRRLRSGH